MPKKKKKSERKRTLKYGSIPGNTKKERNVDLSVSQEKSVTAQEGSTDFEFKKELKKNLVFVGVFFLITILLYFSLTKTNLLSPVLQAIGLGNLYQ